jgi:tRNA threonylcarbamoyladenosine biosynthesis protein TsaE
MKTIKSGEAMRSLGAEVAEELLEAKPIKHARVIALSGELGAGKTTFTQGFLAELGVIENVISPTFLIIRSYPISQGKFTRAYHIDCYRLDSSKELLQLELKKILKNPAHIVLIEWAERVKQYLPADTRWITIEHSKEGERQVNL